VPARHDNPRGTRAVFCRRSYLFSEGSDLHLWQIRHFPNNAQSLRRLTWRQPAIGRSRSAGTADEVRGGHFDCSVLRVPLSALLLVLILPLTSLAQDAKSKSNPADEFVHRAHMALVARQTIQAEIYELVQTDPPFHMTGSYASAGLRTRLSYSVKLNGGATGSLLEVCDGERLWSLTELPGQKRVTRRDVRQILAAVDSAKSRPDRAAAVDLALGGLPALLSSIQRSMQFDAVKDETVDDRKFVVVQARWKSDVAQRLGGDAQGANLPPHIPNLVRIYFDADTQFPERFLYLKKPEDKKTYKTYLELQFRKVVLDGPVDEKLFEFKPPGDVEPEDVTRQYLEQLFPPEPTGKDKAAAGK